MLTFSPELISTPDFVGDVQFVSTADCIPQQGAKSFDSPELKRDLKGLAPGSFLLISEEFAAVDSIVESAHFSTVPGFEYTREDSGQGVMFGELILRTSGGLLYGDHVAIKPFDTPAGAAYELGATLIVNQLDLSAERTNSFVPLGIYKFDDGQYGLITQYDITVRTQDGIFWNPDRSPTETEVNKALGEGARSIGVLHAVGGYGHGDNQPKNNARGLKDTRYVDLVDLRRISQERARNDCGKYLGSLAGRSSRDSTIYTENVREFFVPVYMGYVNAPGSLVPEHARLRQEELLELLS